MTFLFRQYRNGLFVNHCFATNYTKACQMLSPADLDVIKIVQDGQEQVCGFDYVEEIINDS